MSQPRKNETTHEDAQQQITIAKASNPFAVANVLIALGIGFIGWLGNKVWETQQNNNIALEQSLTRVEKNIGEIHDTVISHNIVLTNMQSDVEKLKQTSAQVLNKEEFNLVMDELANKVGPFDGHVGTRKGAVPAKPSYEW